MSKTYLEMVTEDVKEYLRDNEEVFEELPDENLEPTDENVSALYDLLWDEDSVTGNAAGSYTCNRNEALRCIMGDLNALSDACYMLDLDPEEIGDHFLRKDWEWFDVMARLDVLYEACEKALNDIWEENHGTVENIV